MPIYNASLLGMTPSELVKELDKHIVGQADAKRAIANALRNRNRRMRVSEDIRDEIHPYNILMMGPTGVGKTEVVRRVSKLIDAPFIKVEATKFTQIGYAGRDVDSIIRDIVDIAVSRCKEASREEAKEAGTSAAEQRIIDAMVGTSANDETRAKFLDKLRKGLLDNDQINIEVNDTGSHSMMPSVDLPGVQMGIMNIADLMSKVSGGKQQKKIKATVKEAYAQVLSEECDRLIDEDKVIRSAIESVEKRAIVCIDEIDKIAGGDKRIKGGDAGHEGVQRDLLPLIEGTVVNTKYGPVKTDHILFITSGAFHMSRPSDLLPELQGRLPIRVELTPLTVDDFERILIEPKYSMIKQIQALLAVEEVELNFMESGIRRIAELADHVNANVENTGARRLHSLMDKLIEDVSFIADTITGTKIDIDSKYVEDRLNAVAKIDSDMKKFML